MCGIAGIVGEINDRNVAALRRMGRAQVQRGPDAEGEFISPIHPDYGMGAAFAHRRLKIIDLSDFANQPLLDPATGNAIIFNGEIYNYRELRHQLGSKGIAFQSESDTEVLLKAYSVWGESCLDHLRGMFAFAVWDGQKRKVFCARDRMGIKPFYYAQVADDTGMRAILFASQVRALLASELVSKNIDPIGLSTYLWNGFVVGPGTLVEDIKQLPAGHCMHIGCDGSLQVDRYWQIPKSSSSRDPNEVRACLETAVEQHLNSDVPMGMFLSGGKDSSAVSTIASRISDHPIETFTITFEEAEYNEAEYARRVANCIGSNHHEILLTEDRFKAQLPDALMSIDQPTFDGINSYLVSKAVKEAGLTVALAGTGGDELFGGYRSFRDLPWIQKWAQRFSAIPLAPMRPLVSAASRLRYLSFASVPPQTRWGRSLDAIATGGDLAKLYQVAYGLFTEDFGSKLISDAARRDDVRYGLPHGVMERFQDSVSGDPTLHGISRLESAMFLGERLLRDTDAASMAVSLEVRVPLVDHELVELLFSIDEDTRFRPVREKPLLRKMAMWDLPDEVFDRPKLGFELPLDVWCRQGLRATVGETLRNESLCRAIGLNPQAVSQLWSAYESGIPGFYWSRVWSIYVLLWWCSNYGLSLAQ